MLRLFEPAKAFRNWDAALFAGILETEQCREQALRLFNRACRNMAFQLGPDLDETARRAVEHDRGI
ncbi:hypothetical protein [Aureimonas sp. D3]|uniref:hypothetical protein n=1 Tax=Aureimonas sp. D3 TaxID=1638164 RepID=UPI000780377B|nr:hypothetical protein [Aureimonas sp. D3]